VGWAEEGGRADFGAGFEVLRAMLYFNYSGCWSGGDR